MDVRVVVLMPVLAISLCSASADSPEERVRNQRLPGNLVPYHYRVELKPDIYNESGSGFPTEGSVDVYFECRTATDLIILNINGYEPTEGSVQLSSADGAPGVPTVTSFSTNQTEQFLFVQLDSALTAGSRYKLSISWTGQLSSTGRGFYYFIYEDGGETKVMAATQFEPSSARAAFPCFDEPEYKATYDIILVRKPTHIALSNMNIIRQEPRPNNYVADVFNTTVKMSTYTLCFVVCVDFQYRESVSASGVVTRIYARSDAIEYAEFANQVAAKILDWLEDFTGVPYPLPKVDHIAIPRTRGGAMENWGLVTYGEPALLFRPDQSSTSNKQRVGLVISHELGHMWFGNLVTCSWWSEIWINEGFATWFNFPPTEGVLGWPARELQALVTMQPVLATDVTNTSTPVRKKFITSPRQAGLGFGPTTYSKGGSVLRMIRQVLTPEVYRRALNRFLEQKKYDVANTDDLWAAVQQQVEIDNVRTPDGSSLLNVTDVFEPWVSQSGYPLLTVRREGTGNDVTISQKHFLSPKDQDISDSSPWK